MNYLEFIYATSMNFWHSPIIQLILSLLTSISYLFYIRNIQNRENKPATLYTLLFVIINIIIYLNYCAVVKQSLLLLTSLTLFIISTKQINYKNALIIAASFISIIEFSTTIIKESYLTNAISNIILNYLNQISVNIIILILLIIMIMLMSYL